MEFKGEKETINMANEIRTCPNCNSPLTIQNGSWFCPICGSTFATDWQAEDVERAREETRVQREQAQFQRYQAVTQVRQSIQQAKAANEARRSSQARMMRIAKPFLIIFAVWIILSVGRFILFGAVGFSMKSTRNHGGSNNNSNAATATEQKQFFPVEELENDPSLLKDVIASGYYYAKNETAQEIDLSGIARRAGTPELIELYSIRPTNEYGTFIMMVWKNLYQNESGTTFETYISMKIYLESLNPDGTISSDYAPFPIGRPYSSSDGGYTNIDELHQETITESRNAGEKVTELPITGELFSEIPDYRG